MVQRRRFAHGLAYLLLIGAPGCTFSHVTFEPLNPPLRRLFQKRAEQVIVVTTSPQRPHVDYGFLVAHGGIDLDGAQILQSLRQDAAEYGCDALVVAPPSWYQGCKNCGTYRSYSGTCVLFEDP